MFPYVVLTWPQFRAFHAFSFCASLGDIHQGTLTSEGASLVWVNCCQRSRFCGRRSRSLVHREIGDGVFALVIWADIIVPVPGVGIPRLCGGIRMAGWGSFPSLLLGLDPFHLDQGMDLVSEFIWVDELNLGDLHKLHKFLFYSIPEYLNKEPAVSSCIVLCLNDTLVESKDKLLDCLVGFLP